MASLPFTAAATNHLLRMDELMAGLNGNPAIQFVRITVADNSQKAWGPQSGESSSRALLVFFDGAGAETGRFFFPSNAPAGGNSVLIATANFAALPGAPVPDFIIPALISPGNGKVCFRGNPANPGAFDVSLCLSYGNFPPNLTEGAGPPAPFLPITGDPMSLTRFQNFGVGSATSRNADFALASPTPVNTRGQTMNFAVDGPRIGLIPNRLDFSPRNFNTGPSAAQTLTITNRGILNPLLITNVFLTGSNTNQFAIVTDTRQTNLPPGGTRTLTVNFNPTSPGTKTAAVRITSNDTNAIVTDVPLQGLGVDPNAPEIEVIPLTLNFGIVDLALGPTVPQNVIISNSGAIGTLTVTNLALVGFQANQFRIVTATNQAPLAPRASRTASIQFAPDSAGFKSALMRIVSSDTDERIVDVALQGRAFDLNPCTAPNPTNSVAQDICTNAQLICPGLAVTGTVFGATADGSSSCGGVQPDVWYRYVPASDGTLDVTVTGFGFAPVLSAHADCPGTAANELACDNAGQRQPPAAEISVPVTNGVPVFLRVAGVGNSNTTFRLMIEDGPPCFDFDRNKNGVTDNCEFDFGDAPAPYPTTLAADGARHRVFTGVFLGSRIDSNDDGLPTSQATGDNLDGQPNDDDGVTLTSPLVLGQTASVQVAASASGFLNAWIDFNANGDWSDPGEQIFTNMTLTAGVNVLAFDVPASAVPTNLTFARWRFNSTGGLSVTGAASDGEVEDYAVEILPPSVAPGQIAVRINEVMAGLNGDSTIQFVELEAFGNPNKAWGPQGTEFAGRAMLAFFDEAGNPGGRFVFPSNAPAGADTVLVATRAFADFTGVTPDFIMPPEVVPIAGKVAFRNNPDNSQFEINIALSYGGSAYAGLTDSAGPANTNELPILHANSLGRAQDIAFGLNRNDAFQAGVPTPRNTAGQTFSFSEVSIPEQGRVLFTREPFRGNGRTCATCHVAGREQFSLTPASIAALRKDDPLFVFETNINVLRLAGPSQPSDLRGTITGTRGSARVLGGSGDTFYVLGGTNLSGTIRDTNGNFSFFLFLSRGNLNGPTPGNGSARGLEDAGFLEQGRGLVLENIDGFKRGEVFRAPPHLLNLAFTAPYGLSGEFDSLEDFTAGAVVQHFPRSLGRTNGVDFRQPTAEELTALSAFMLGISSPDTNRFDLDRLATTEAQKRGRALFFGDAGRCSKCHSGPALALSDGTLPGSRKGVSESFDTGVASLLRNITDGLPTEPAGLAPGSSTRRFNTPSLFNVKFTAPFFHDNSASNLTEAVKFYDTPEFHVSPAGQQVGSLLAANKAALVADVVAFLESLVDLPVDFTRQLAFGIRCPGQPLPGPMIAMITNIGANTITITNVSINGTNAGDFTIVSDTGETNLAPGQTRSIQIAFAPVAKGVKQATLEITAVDTNLLGSFGFGVALSGADVDNLVTADPASIDFGTRDIDAPPSPVASIVIANDGSTDLDISGMVLTGPTPGDFTFAAETNPIAPHDIRVLEVSFAPRTQGAKSALVRIPILSCNTVLIEIPLAGVAGSSVHHFAWDPIAATQYVGTPFPARITAVDRNGDTVQSFRGTVRFLSVVGTQTNTVLISPTNSTPFVNGVWTGSITVQQPAILMRVLARDSQSHTGLSGAFAAPLPDDLSLAMTDAPDPVSGGAALTYTIVVQNTGPNDATGVLVTNVLSPGVAFSWGSASQGLLASAGGTVDWTVGTLARGISATATIVTFPNPGFPVVTNVASVTRNGVEAVITNNVVTTVTTINPFGLLVVLPVTDFFSVGLSGGPFTPTNQTYAVSNAGTAPISWIARADNCTTPPDLVAWLPWDGTANDLIGTNTPLLVGSPAFRSGFVGQSLSFDGIDDQAEIAASPSLDVGAAAGLTIELWLNPADIAAQQPLLEWNNRQGLEGLHFWLSQSPPLGGGPGCLYANLVDTVGVSHRIASTGGLVVTGLWQHVALTYSTSSGQVVLYLNGVAIAQQQSGSFSAETRPPFDLFLGRRDAQAFRFVGAMDEVSLYSRALTSNEVASIFLAGSAGKCRNQFLAGPVLGCATPPVLVSWWPLEGNTADLGGTNAGIIVGNPVFTNGFIRGAMFFDGLDDGVRIAVSPELNFGTNVGFTFEAWFNVPNNARRNPLFEYDDGSSFSGPFLFAGIPTAGALAAGLIDIGNGVHGINTSGNLFAANSWNHVAITYNKTSGTATIYVNGAIVQQQNLGSFTMKTVANLFLGRRDATGFEESMLGMIDEPAVYGRELTASEVQSIFVAGSVGKCGPGVGASLSPMNCAALAGLVAWWKADGNATDFVGTNHGSLQNGVAFAPGKVGQGFRLDGVDDFVLIPDSAALDLTNEITVELWYKTDASRPSDPLFGKRAASGVSNYGATLSSVFGLQVYYNDPQVNDGDFPGSGFEISAVPPPLPAANVFHHFTATFRQTDSNQVELQTFVDAVLVRTRSIQGNLARTVNDVALVIGTESASGGPLFQGVIDEVSLYNRVLSATEIQGIFGAGSAGKCQSLFWLSVSASGGTLGPGASTNVSFSINTNANLLPVGRYADSILFTNTVNARGTTTRDVTLSVVNRRPTLNSIASFQFPEDSGPRTINLSGITAGGAELQGLTVIATSDHPALIPNPVAVNYTSPNTTGTLTIALSPNANGTAVVSVVVRDDGGAANGGVDAVTNIFVVTVTPVNDPPVLAPVTNQTVSPGSRLTINNMASDPDLPDDQLTFSLEGPPSGAMIDPASGVFTWMPGQAQGLTTNLIIVIVQDAGLPPLSATNQFTVTVLESNSPPVLAPISPRTVHEDTPVAFTVAASDPDLPWTLLSYSLGAGAPAGASINPTNGLFAWTASGVPVPSTNQFSVFVTDNGAPPLSDQQAFSITVVARPLIQLVSVSSNVVSLGWSAILGASYRVQFKAALEDPAWTDLPGDVTATGDSASKTDNPSPAVQRFYRVSVLP